MAPEAGGIGARLRAGREKLGLTVLQVAERIHTDPRIVEAIEAENFPALGAPVYARGHIRHYAELVDESASELVGLYSHQSRVAQPDLTQIVKAPADNHSNRLVAPALLVIAVFAVAGAVWWVSALSKKKPQMAETHVVSDEASQAVSTTTAPTTPAPAPAAAPATPAPAQPSPTPSSMTQRSTEQKPTESRASEPRVPAPRATEARTPEPRPPAPRASDSRATDSRLAAPRAAAPTAVLPPTRVASAAPTANVSSNTPATGAASLEAPVRAKNQAQVTLRYTADSWTEVYDASGARLFYDVGPANSVRTVVGTPPLRVVLGNAAGVAVEFNGHNTPIANLSQADGSVQFSISRAGKVARAKSAGGG